MWRARLGFILAPGNAGNTGGTGVTGETGGTGGTGDGTLRAPHQTLPLSDPWNMPTSL